MKSTDKLSMSIGIAFALILGGFILSYNKLISKSVESSEIKEATIVKSLSMEDTDRKYNKINKQLSQISKDVSVNKHIVIDSNNNGVRDDNDIVFDNNFIVSLPAKGKVLYFDILPSELKNKKELKDIKVMPKYIVTDNKLYVYLPREGSNMIYLHNKYESIPLAAQNRNGKYDIINLPSKLYGKKGKQLDEDLYNMIEMKQNIR